MSSLICTFVQTSGDVALAAHSTSPLSVFVSIDRSGTTICFHYFFSLPLWISDHSWSSRQPWWEASRGNENASSVDAWRRPTASRKAEQVWSSEKLDDEELRRQAKWKSQEVKNVGTSSEVGPFLSISKHWLIFIHFSAPNWEPSVGRSFSDSLEEAVQAYMAQHDADLVREHLM